MTEIRLFLPVLQKNGVNMSLHNINLVLRYCVENKQTAFWSVK
jgi:hypothetical protein